MMSREEAIVKNAYMVPSLITPNIEALIGAEMARSARKSGQRPKLPETRIDTAQVANIDLRIMAFLSGSSKPMERGEIATALGVTTEHINTPLQRLRMRGHIKAKMEAARRYSYTVEAAQ